MSSFLLCFFSAGFLLEPAVADGDEVPGVQASSLTGKSKHASASRIFCMTEGILDKIYRITEFFGRRGSASEAWLRAGLQSILRAAAWGVDLIEQTTNFSDWHNRAP